MRRIGWCGALFAAFSLTLGLPATSRAGEIVLRDLARKYFKDGDGADLSKLVGYKQPVKEVIALEYKVLLFKGGRETAVDPKTYSFHLGDKIRIAIEPLSSNYVYIFHIGASGESRFLLPTDDESPPTAKAGKQLALPDDGFFEFNEPPGEEMVLVVATEKPVADRKVLARVLAKKPGETDTAEEKAVRSTIKATVKKAMKSARERQKEILDNSVTYRGILANPAEAEALASDVRTRSVTQGTFEEPPHGPQGGTTAVYASETKQPDARLMVTIPLKSVRDTK